MDIYSSFATRFEKTREEELSLEEYLALCKDNPAAYATAGERMLTAIGEPEQIDTRNDPRLSRIFANKVIKVYPAFREFYGMEDVIEQVVAYFRHAAQGLVLAGIVHTHAGQGRIVDLRAGDSAAPGGPIEHLARQDRRDAHASPVQTDAGIDVGL